MSLNKSARIDEYYVGFSGTAPLVRALDSRKNTWLSVLSAGTELLGF